MRSSRSRGARAARAPSAAAAPARPGSRGALVLALDCALVVALWLAFVRSLGHGGVVLGYDSIRDISYALGIARGQVALDPMLAGMPAWYPPGMPALFALASYASGRGIAECYASAAWWAAWCNPLVLFLLVRAVWGRASAWVALPCVLLGSRWWMLHAAIPMASVQTVVLVLGTLWAWHRAALTGGGWRFLALLLGAATLWCHVLCGSLALGAIALHACGDALHRRLARNVAGPGLLGRAATVVGGAGVLGAPPLVLQLGMVRLNDAPHHWFGPELWDARFALHAWSPFVALFGLAGVVLAVRDWRRTGWLAAYFFLALVGSMLGYAGHGFGAPVPWIIPHEFQWHEQLALMIAAATAITALARGVAARTGRALAPAVTVAALVLAVGPAVPQLGVAGSYLLTMGPEWKPVLATANWLGANAAVNSVVAASPAAGYLVCGLSGSRVVSMPAGHLNPAAAAGPLGADLATMLATTRESTFVRLARLHGVGYLLATNDHEPQELLHARYEHWASLEPVFRSDSAAVLYRVRL
ncbi:MAG: hypothetical protein HZA61_14155 [Candidatus Eisenbacteria bacterium]|uniref:Uncharacterized protein n=1 Tax=Eiseniibacteriota bacterium TaxID=2212470 RepID=A0A933SF68_UNCEI|nr:hypothetical protein [Candidatus Eisenbacteria bacterium]